MKMNRMRDRGEPGAGSGDPTTITSLALRALDDTDCVVLARSGNETAIEELVRRHTPGVYNLQYRLLGTREAAEDATQETFMRAYRNLTRFDPRRVFKAWLYAIAWNYARDELRRRKRRSGVPEARPGSRRAPPTASAADEPCDYRTAAPAEAVVRKEEEEWVHRALHRLRPQERAVLLLREFEGLSYEDLARLFACRVGTVKSRLNRARLELKRVMTKLRPDWFS